MNIFGLAALFVGGLFSVLVLLYLFVGLIVVLVWKAQRSMRTGCSFFD